MNRRALRWYAAFYRSSRGRLILGAGLSFLRALALLPIPLLVAVAIDDAIAESNISELVGIGVVILVLTVTSAAIGIASRRVLARVTMKAQAGLREAAVAALLRMSRRTYSKADDGVLHDHVLQETKRVEQGTSAIFDDFLPGTVLIIGVSFGLIRMNVVLTAVTLLFVPIIFLASRWLGRHVDARIERDNRSFERFSHSIISMLRSMDLIRIQAAEEVEVERQEEAIDRLRDTSIDRSVGITMWVTIQQSLVAIAGSAVLIVGGVLTIQGSMSLGDLIAFYAAFALLRGPLSVLADRTPFVIEGVQSLDRLYGLLHGVDERPYTGTEAVELKGSVTLSGVSFAYDRKPVLEEVSLELAPGKVVGLVGPNGSGKSTIVNLIVGFYRPDVGDVFAEGVPYDTLDLTVLRRQMGIVPQQPLLRSGTILENILYGREGISLAEVQTALRLAEAEAFVEDLPDGLETAIGEDGIFLSGGQRQRVAIARALVHRPPLLILDEPTNHLDRWTVSAVVNNIRGMDHRPAVLLVSHRTEVLAEVDVTIDIKDGRIVSVASREQ
ncbi:MAG: ABC transporter ATP-binding protein [Acidimicrobiia bacterium]